MKKFKKNPFARGVFSLALVALGVILYPKDGIEASELISRSLASGISIAFGAASLLLLLFPKKE